MNQQQQEQNGNGILALLFDFTKSLFQKWLFYGIGTMFSMAVLAAMTSIALKMVAAVSEALWGCRRCWRSPATGECGWTGGIRIEGVGVEPDRQHRRAPGWSGCLRAVQEQLSDPASQRVHVDRAQAISQDVPSSTRQVGALAQVQEAIPAPAQTQQPMRREPMSGQR